METNRMTELSPEPVAARGVNSRVERLRHEQRREADRLSVDWRSRARSTVQRGVTGNAGKSMVQWTIERLESFPQTFA
jgi:hypothetical protein